MKFILALLKAIFMAGVPQVGLIEIRTLVSHTSTKDLTIEVNLAESRCYKYLLTGNAVKS
jgi:hypothetical protein